MYLTYLFLVWQSFNIDTTIGSGAYGLSLGLDNNYKPHILYVRKDSLFYYFNGKIKPIGYGTMPSIALDKDNIPHISVIYNGVGYKKLNTKQLEYIDTNVCYYASICLDNNNLPHIAYVKRIGGFFVGIFYAYFDNQSWHVEFVDTLCGDFGEVSIKLDKFNIPHLTYSSNEVYQRLKYASKINGVWEKEIVDSTYSDELLLYDAQPSIAIDSFYRPCIAYWRVRWDWQKCTELRYAVKDEGVWKIEIVDAQGLAGMEPSLCIDKYNLPHISYIKNNNLTYAVNDGFSWNIFDNLDNIRPENGGLLSNTAIAVDGSDNVYIAYNKEKVLNHSIMKYIYGKGLDSLKLYIMLKIYPTVGRKLKIIYSLTKDNFVNLTIYNLLGEIVCNLINDRVSAGVHRFEFDGKNLSCGVYFCLLKAEALRVAKKFIIY